MRKRVSIRWLILLLVGGMVVGPARAIDRNGNGLNDVWEAVFGVGRDPGEDEDGDDESNRAESIAGTDPDDAMSVLRIDGVEIRDDSVRLRWPAVPGKYYLIQVNTVPGEDGWQDVGHAEMATSNEGFVEFPLRTTYLTGAASHSVWQGLANNSLRMATIREMARTGSVPPTEDGGITVLETPSNSGSRYAQWIRGWIVPPSTGEYRFSIASDDQSELWISTSDDPADARVVASVPNYTGPRDWSVYPEQVSGPIGLQAHRPVYFEVFMYEINGGDNLSVAWSGPGFEREILTGRHLTRQNRSLHDLAAGGGLFYRAVVSDEDTDGDEVTDYEEVTAGLDRADPNTTPRVDDLVSLGQLLDSPNTVTVGTAKRRAYEATGESGQFVINRSGGISPIGVDYVVSGSATSGVDYERLSGTVMFGPAQSSVVVEVEALDDGILEPGEDVTVTLLPSAGYQVGSPSAATVTIDDAPDRLYVATLRGGPAPDQQSGGSGYALLRVAGNSIFATVSLQFSNLEARQTGTEIFVSATGEGGETVLTLPLGQLPGQRWEFEAAGGHTRETILAALESGRLHLRVSSEFLPTGEIRGVFLPNQGWQYMPEPPDVPIPPEVAPGAALTDAQAARFLTQATFGPTDATIAELRTKGIDQWLSEQVAMAPTLHLPLVQTRRQELLARSGGLDDGWQSPRHEAWWQHALTAPDQLRQRMAFALSEIFVISQVGVLDGSHEGVTNYYDHLVRGAFGSYRDLLEEVTLSPMMGLYLSMIKNRKPDPVTGAEPDENYAREVMQLFSIGLSQLHRDGSLRLDAEGMPIPTYDQDVIVGFAHVFTGWGYAYSGTAPNIRWAPANAFDRMMQYPGEHDLGPKRLLDGVVLPAGQTGEKDLADALDLLAEHPNVAPFISRQLIQRFVTSNPSPGYIHRVATAFEESDGNLGETVRAILTDHEARNTSVAASATFGKLREPVLRISHLLRAMKAKPPLAGDSRFFINLQWVLSQQAPLQSPSVFNFFQPGYVPPGRLAAAGLYGPEFQITSETTTISQANEETNLIRWGRWTPELLPGTTTNAIVRLDLADELAILKNPDNPLATNLESLLDHLNKKLLDGRMSPELRQGIRDGWAALPGWYVGTDERLLGRVQLALSVIYTSPEYAVQK